MRRTITASSSPATVSRRPPSEVFWKTTQATPRASFPRSIRIHTSSGLRKAGFIWGEITRDNVRRARRRKQWTEVLPTAQISFRIDLGRLAEEWISTRCKLGLGSGIVAIIAGCHRIDEIAAQSNQSSILSLQLKRNRCDVEAALDS